MKMKQKRSENQFKEMKTRIKLLTTQIELLNKIEEAQKEQINTLIHKIVIRTIEDEKSQLLRSYD